MTNTRRRSWIGIGAAAATIGALLIVPTARDPSRSVSTGSVATPPAGRTSPPGPDLATVWPHARTFDIPAIVAGGFSYQPLTILDATTSVGTVTSPDGNLTGLIQATGAGSIRRLDWQPDADAMSIDAITATDHDIYWIQSTAQNGGDAQTGLWRADRTSGPPHQISADVGTTRSTGSQYDLQIVAGRAYWMTAPTPDRSALRSVPVAGGPVTTRNLPGSWTPTAWPWITTTPDSSPDAVQLQNLLTGARHALPTSTDQQATCTPQWCRVIDTDPTGTSGIQLVRPDGTQRQTIATANDLTISPDVCLQNRFEPIATLTGAPSALTQQLFLYDLTNHQRVLIAPDIAKATAHHDYLWWATGDYENTTWHALDLRTLH
jgi:hypothetical protein